ncbi:MAG TPA: hypothetical protein PK668_16315 [Myxococcota bacterium]|nr:hypothetical protein [Myxococcota bacterium]HRY94457.1 hypothetical protein [Myxococcota bacterium]HSA23075.1 hypothetical protein [Myxococcota bacterium]
MSADSDRKLERIERHYLRIFEHLDPGLLTSGQALEWPGGRSDEPERSVQGSPAFLGYYTQRGLEVVFERYGLMERLHALGFRELEHSLERHPEGYDIFRVFTAGTRHPLIELIARIGPLPPETLHLVGDALPACEKRLFLNVKWLRMQNPFVQQPAERPLFPGQAFPGLGIGREMMALLQMICVRLELDGVYELPERLHNAVLYFRRFRFLDPELQGVMTAILRDTQQHQLVDLAWNVECGNLTDERTGRAFRWIPSEQVLPRTGPVRDFLDSPAYREQATRALERSRFRLASADLAVDLAGGADLLGVGDNPIPARIK